MSQNYNDDVYAGNMIVATSMTRVENNFAALKSSFSGAAAPSNPVDGMLWKDTTNNLLKMYHTSAWVSIWDYSTGQPVGIPIDAAQTTASMRTLGSNWNQACAGNDARLSNSRPASGGYADTAGYATSAGNADTVDGIHFRVNDTGMGFIYLEALVSGFGWVNIRTLQSP
jgi:hypothetical protein